ncbi:bifunctional lysylphosphatidylglycerol flippase/synthetase MprF [uncultured Clostridium sp.]|uniref:bifunctional lysylphosphatidylglycerol flippase/synthetase MprF n=1 Tax=uncultured Clostridium sp. TaxID=59620 RepID=UPI002603AB6B|nr:bifunctional lysylphosphatidylglycerol flippase/synthetase MprF [uncultured Clostridium sp.]
MKLLKKKKVVTTLKVLFGILLVILLVLGIRGFMGDFNMKVLEKSLKNMYFGSLVFIIILGIIAFSPMCLYDYLIKRKLGFNISNKRILKYGFIVNAITIVAGLGDAAGISLRTYFYKNEQEDKKKLLVEVSKISILNPSGLSILAILYLIFYVRGNDIFNFGNICAFIIALYIPGILIYIAYKNKKNNTATEGKFTLGIVISSLLDWGLSIGLFYSIIKILGLNVTFGAFFPVFIIAMLIGIVSMLPGAVGAFDLSMLIGLSSIGVPKEVALFSVFLYRLAYYIVPLAIAGILLIHEFWIRSNKRTKEIFSLAYTSISFTILRLLVFLSGVALLLSNAIPGVVYRVKELKFLSDNTEMHFPKFLVIIVGFLLIVMAALIKTRAKIVYYLTVIFLIIGTLLTIFRSFNLIAVTYLIIVFIVIILSRKAFTRESFIVSLERMLVNLILLVGLWVVYLIGIYLNYPFKLYTLPFIFKRLNFEYRDLISSSTLGLILGITFMVVMYYIGKYTNKMPKKKLEDCEDEVKNILSKYNGTSLTHLIYLRDKYIYISEKYECMIQYSIMSNKVFVLGNPLGEIENMGGFIEEFYDFVDSYGYTPIFFEVSSKMFGILHEFGYEFLKVGEAAIVDLDKFTIAGQKMQKVRTCCNKINKAGYSFEIVEENINNDVLKELKIISDEWLDGRNEMGFSIGFFDEEYIKKGPVGLVRDDKGVLKAFVTLMPSYGENKKLCSDLMRFTKHNPRGVMDYMFVKVMEWGKEKGYENFDFGVAPLSNVGTSKYSFLSERIACQIYLYGKGIYSFDGLRKFKAKYAHRWQPKFLAYKSKIKLPLTTLQANLIVSRSEKNKEKL